MVYHICDCYLSILPLSLSLQDYLLLIHRQLSGKVSKQVRIPIFIHSHNPVTHSLTAIISNAVEPLITNTSNI